MQMKSNLRKMMGTETGQKEKFYFQWPYYFPLKLWVLFLPFTFSANFSQSSVRTLSTCTILCIGFPGQSIKGSHEERKGFCRMTLDTLNIFRFFFFQNWSLFFDPMLHLNILNIRHLGQKNSVLILLTLWRILGKKRKTSLKGKKRNLLE